MKIRMADLSKNRLNQIGNEDAASASLNRVNCLQ